MSHTDTSQRPSAPHLATADTLDAAIESCAVLQYRPVTARPTEHARGLASEVRVALQYNGSSHVVMLPLGMNLLHWPYGFSYSKGIIRQPADIYDCEVHHTPQGY